MPQLEVIKFRDLIPIQSVPRYVPGFDNPTIEITGEDFSSAASILINEVPAPEFIIVNKHSLYVQLPEAAQNGISTIEVLSSKFTRTTSSSKISYEIGDKTRTVSGILKLVQLFTKWIMQSPDSDIFNPERGGGLQELVGNFSSTKQMDRILTALTRSVGNTVTQIRASQSNIPSLPLDERLLSAEIIDLDVYAQQMEARARVFLRSVAGDEALASLEL